MRKRIRVMDAGRLLSHWRQGTNWWQTSKRLKRLVALPRRVALVVVYDLPVRAQALLGLVAPAGAVARVRNGGVPFRLDVQAFPAQRIAAIIVERSQRRAFARH